MAAAQKTGTGVIHWQRIRRPRSAPDPSYYSSARIKRWTVVLLRNERLAEVR